MNRQNKMGGGSRSNQWNNGADYHRRAQNPYQKFNPYQNSRQRRRRNRDEPFGRPGPPRKRDEDCWYKVMVPYGKKMGKVFILKSLAEWSRVTFNAVNFFFQGNQAVFYVSDYNTFLALRELNNKIPTPGGYKMALRISQCPVPPVTHVDDAVMETIKKIMSERYNVQTKQLDLTKFHEDPGLKASGIYVPLNIKKVFDTCVRIIKEHIPDLQTLLLGNNKIAMLEPMKDLVGKCRSLRSISLSKNNLKTMAELDHIKGMQIQELVLDGNPLCDLFNDQTSYISAVRDRLPKVMKLDGETLSAPIGFNLEPEEPAPPVMGSFFPSDDVKQLVVQFLEQYFSIYDSNNRQPLIDAYHDEALFSLSLVKTMRSGQLNPYVKDSRNFLFVGDNSARDNLLHRGKTAIVDAFRRLPATQHDPSSFVVDVSYVSSQLMSFTVMGVFKETGPFLDSPGQGPMPLRTFSRTFLVIPQGNGFSIVNETLLVTNATVDQVKAHKEAAAASAAATTISVSPAPASAASDHSQLVLQMSTLTGMNAEFSAKCLLEYDWNLEAALTTFRKLHVRVDWCSFRVFTGQKFRYDENDTKIRYNESSL